MKKRHTACEVEIRRLNPGLMELSLGCELIVTNGSGKNKETRRIILGNEELCISNSGEMGTVIIMEKPIDGGDIFEYPYEIERIIGHPITLEALLKVLRTGVIDEYFFVDNEGDFHRGSDEPGSWDNSWESCGVRWTFEKPFIDQPDETKDFICDILNIKQ